MSKAPDLGFTGFEAVSGGGDVIELPSDMALSFLRNQFKEAAAVAREAENAAVMADGKVEAAKENLAAEISRRVENNEGTFAGRVRGVGDKTFLIQCVGQTPEETISALGQAGFKWIGHHPETGYIEFSF